MTSLADYDALELGHLIAVEQSILAGMTLEPETASDLHAFVRRDLGAIATTELIRAGVLRLLGDGRLTMERGGYLYEDARPKPEDPAAKRRSRLSPLAARTTRLH
jgi:hypothetical protein